MPDGNEDKLNKQGQTTHSPETRTPAESNDFPKIKEFVSQKWLEGKKDIIDKVLTDNKIKEWFEKFLSTANPRIKLKIKKDLLNCKTKEEVKSIIVENLPWYKIWEENNREDWNKTENGSNPGKNWDLWSEVISKQKKEEQAQKKEGQAQEIEEQVNKEKNTTKGLGNRFNAVASATEILFVKRKELIEKAEETRSKLSKKHTDLEENTKKWSEKYNKVKNELENKWILNQIRQKTKDEEFVNSYILSQTTLLEAKSNPEYSKDEIWLVEKIVKQMNNVCNIPDTSLDSFSSEKIWQTRKELFNEDIWNDSIISAKKSNMESRDYSKVFPEMWDDELISKYWNQLEWELKDFWNQYQSTPEIKNKINEIKNNPNPTEEEKKLLKNYEDMIAELRKIKEWTEIQAKDLIEEMYLISQIKWLSMCIWKERENDFNFNKANEIQNNNWVLTLQWHIDGIDFSVRQDTNNPEAHLQTYSKLATTREDKNTFVIWWENNYVDSPFILPSQQEIFAKITEVVQSDSENLKNAENQETYLENLQKEILSKMDDLYKDTELAHHYITNKVKWEKIVDSSLWMIQYIKPDFDFSKSINQISNAKLYSFLKIINFNIENSTTEEKDKFNRCINEIGRIIKDYKSNKKTSWFYSEEISKHLENDARINWTEDDRLKHFFDLFNDFNKNPTDKNKEWFSNDWISSYMIINDLHTQLIDKPNQKKQEKERENKTNADIAEADQILDLENESIWA